MPTPILTTKLYIPLPRPELVPRPRLIERLNEGLHRKLTLISAPAGFGKTTLLSSWINQNSETARLKDRSKNNLQPSNVAWLSLDEGDNDLTRFLTYLVAALQRIAPHIGETALAALQSPQPPSPESILTTLLNDIAALSNKIILVLDDYHVVESQPVDQTLTFWLEHLPPPLHLVIATREDPPLPVARLRVRGQVTELRAADLRFTRAEAADFLNQVMGLNLAAEDITALENRTEGWIAGLQLAALSMQGHTDTANFIESFTGSHRFVLDYLVEEVLHRQPESVQTFLLQTSILDRLCGPLCDAILGNLGKNEANNSSDVAQPSSAILEYIEQANLFIIPLDNERRWYRYHHLFADLLRQRLQQHQPEQVANLHRRASRWFEANSLLPEAIHHALAAQDFEQAAALLELIWPTMSGSFQSAMWLGWAQPLPEAVLRLRPVLSAAYAWALLDAGELEAGEARLRDAEQWLDGQASPTGEMIVVDERQFQTLPGSIATARSYLAQALGDTPGSVRYARQVLDLSPEDDLIRRGQAASLLALAHWADGELDDAHRVLGQAMANFRVAGQLVFAISGTYGLADIRLTQGRLREAVSTYQQAVQLVETESKVTLPGVADLYLGLGDLQREQGDLAAAQQYLDQSAALGEPAALPDWPYRFRLAQSRLKMAQGDLSAALTLLDDAERFYFRSPMPEVRPLAALKVRLWLALNRLPEAQNWVQERELSAEDELSYLREFEHLTLARVRIAQYQQQQTEESLVEALHLLGRLLQAAEAGDRWGSVIEILTQQALAHQTQGDHAAALAALQRALTLAQPEGHVRIFVDEGTPLAELLSRLKDKSRGQTAYIDKLLAAFGVKKDVPSLALDPQPLVEPLSEREMDILRLVAEGLSNREISERLFLALSTVKGHNRNIYGKLQVQRRTEAVARARELGLL